MDAMEKERRNLQTTQVWDPIWVRDWKGIARTAHYREQKIHLARIFGIMVEKGSELPEDDPHRKFKYRVVYQGNNVVDENWEFAVFQDLGSSPASMEAGKMADAYGSMLGHDLQQADAEQAYRRRANLGSLASGGLYGD